MKKLAKNKLTIFLSFIIVLSLGLIVFKAVNNSYAYPELEDPTITKVDILSDDPVKVKISYILNNIEDNYTLEILNGDEVKVSNDSLSNYKNNGSNEYIIEGLEKGKTYNFYVKMCADSDNCVTSSKSSITIESEVKKEVVKETNVIGNVSNINVSNVTSNSAYISFNRVSGATGYRLKYKSSAKSNWTTTKVFNTNSVNLTSLKAKTKYQFKVVAVKSGKEGSYSTERTFKTTPKIPNVKGFTAKGVSPSQVELNWKKINKKKISYFIYRSTDGKRYSYVKSLSYKKTSYIDKKLSANRVYYYKIRAVDKKSNKNQRYYGNYSAVKKAKTPLKNKKTYILVSIKKQKLWYYKKGKLKYTSYVVTGNSGNHSTPKGTYAIRGKSRSAYLVGRDYVSFVNYWMLIDSRSQIGLHDATWRSSFGGKVYKGNGSHGCINLPFKTAKYLYNHASVGTMVIVK